MLQLTVSILMVAHAKSALTRAFPQALLGSNQ